MLVIVAVIETSADDIAALKNAIATMEQASREEEGCEDYTFCVELNDPTRMRITERWRDEAALKAHFESPHMAAFNQAMAGAPPKSVSVTCYEATEVPFPVARGS